MNTSSLDQKINSLKPGGTHYISKNSFVERSGDGKTLRFVRISGNTWSVFKTCSF